MSEALLRVLGAIAVGSFLLLAFTPAANVLRFWASPAPSSEAAQAIVVLGAGGVTTSGALTNTSLRGAMEAIALFQKGLAPLVVFSGSPESRIRGEAEARAELARACGVPGSAILTSGRAHTTHEEAVQVRALLQSQGVRKIMLVADAAGMARAMAVFQHAGFDVIPPPGSDTLDLGGGPEDRLGLLRQLAMETVARVYYRAAGYF
jgi:uncharacterized SAM-binding protein YcdF (DUF218 family)